MTHPMKHNGNHNGINGRNTTMDQPTIEELEAELPIVQNDQVPLSEVLSRVVQDIYAELMTLADTLPSSSDSARKRMLADFVVKHKKQVVKLFAVVQWARDAKDVQKCMNITAFLMEQNAQFVEAVEAITLARESLAPAKLRNHDILTSLDVLTTGSYQRLPTVIKKIFIPPKRLSKEDISRTLAAIDHIIRFRLRMTELVPVELNKYSVSSAQVHFHVPRLFSVSLSLRGAEKGEPWFLVDVEFDIKVGGDDTGVVEFPRSPTGVTKQHIVDEADARLARYIASPVDAQATEQPTNPATEPKQQPALPARPKLPENAIDAPLVRLYNFMQMMSLSYQLEILCYQAQRMRSLGWADYLNVLLSNDRKTLTVTYWIRQPPTRQPTTQLRNKAPLLGGTITISIEPKPPTTGTTLVPSVTPHPPGRSHKDRVLHELGLATKLKRQGQGQETPKFPSDEVERLCLNVKWVPEASALGFVTNPADWLVQYEISPDDLDFQGLLMKAVRRHSEAILTVFRRQLAEGPFRQVFSNEEVILSTDGDNPALQILLCAGEVVIVTIDTRTGRFNLRDTGDLAAAGRGPRFAVVTDRINETPIMIVNAIVTLRYNTIVESAEQKAIAMGLQTYRSRNMSREETAKFGPTTRAHLFIRLHNFPTHYLVLVVADDDFKHALVSVKTVMVDGNASMVMDDIGWLDVARIRGNDLRVQPALAEDQVETGSKRKAVGGELLGRSEAARPTTESFKLESDVIRELYAYCCARVSHMKVEQQLKSRGIPYTHVMPYASPELSRAMPRGIHSSLALSVPVLCVQSKDILSGVPAAEAAMPNIRVVPINWWSERKCQVVTCVKLKYVQPPVGKTAGMGSSVIRPSKSVIYDTREAIVSFLSDDVNTCVDEFLDEWARVSTIVVIAREVSQMAKTKRWDDVRLLSFDLQTVEFTYTTGYALSISCNQQSSGGSYQLKFSRISPSGSRTPGVSLHDEATRFLRPLLRTGRLATSLSEMVEMLRDTLPMALELETLTSGTSASASKVDVYPKACGWYRALLGDLRHALDFRLMTQQRVVVMDGSHSIFRSSAEDDVQDSLPGGAMGVLQPVPDFAQILTEVLRDARVDGWAGDLDNFGIALIDVGLVCSASVAGKIGVAVFRKVQEKLKGSIKPP
ncbi:mediator complex subunit MED14-domain-containing protein [Hysterangium stoloniferum]|nr:mediator complex subunit MED14-domain-containing protein [Hysterangium stoloniferum]